ncbi:general transcription factor II-I repeat domain-containing protein 2A-like [Dendropsophus ebraccatus]|uniref:general transcription factor II-I repeat domain-containing protein 2A-like n=1 Tax=Dendropsophus ebraccatus TaxID=150705 RepID=UPI0038311877
MATSKKRKVDAECRAFQEKWTHDYFFLEVKGKPVCLVCGEALAVMKKANLERHYSSRHAKHSDLKGQMRLDKINALQRTLESQQAAFTRPRCDRDNVIHTSYVVSELIAKRLRPHIEGEFVKECMVAAAELLAPDKLKLFKSVSLSRRTVSDRITDLAQDIEKTLKDSAGDFQFFSLALDETTDLTNTAHCLFFKGLNSRQFKELLNDLDSEYGDLVYYCEVRWLSRGNMLIRFYELRDEVKQFMEMKGKPGPNQFLSSLLSHVKSFEAKLKLWKVQLERSNTVHFPILEGQKPSTTLEYAGECAQLIEAFSERFQDLQSNDELKARYNNVPLLEFYKHYLSNDEFPTLRKHALKYASVFGTTYCCEHFFSKLTIAKCQLRTRLTETNLENQLRVATSSVPAHVKRIAKEKHFHFQPSH